MSEEEAHYLLSHLDPQNQGFIHLQNIVTQTQKPKLKTLPKTYQKPIYKLFKKYSQQTQQSLMPSQDFLNLVSDFALSPQKFQRQTVKRVTCDLSKFTASSQYPTEFAPSPTRPVHRSKTVFSNSPTKTPSKTGQTVQQDSYSRRHFERKNTMERVQLQSQSIHESVSRRANQKGAKLYDFLRSDSIQSPVVDDGAFERFVKSRKQ